MKIVIDAFGGDNAPGANVDGAVKAVNKYDDVEIILTGDETKINAELAKYSYPSGRISVVHAPDVITNDDVPTTAVRTKTNSSMVVGLDLLKSQSDVAGFISSGSTGALLTGGVLRVGRMRGVQRPALCISIITKKGGEVAMLDLGASADCTSKNLSDFAAMGSLFFSAVCGKQKPKVALLSNGTEDHKGNELIRETHLVLKEDARLASVGEFVGNTEARDILSGNFDVVVADGFTGNAALKAVECGVDMVAFQLKNAVKNGSFFAKLGGLLFKKSMKNAISALDYNKFGGAVLLGCSKLIVKSHGAGSGDTIFACVRQVRDFTNFKLLEKISGLMDPMVLGQ